ncbi:MAG: GMC family oxidoreductase N-terminal domain-containing protein [Actinomycetota bacterium]
MERISTEFAVVGSGAGGGTIARELALKGRDVVVLEKGRWHKQLGYMLSMAYLMDRMALFSRSKEGVLVDRAITAGGSTVVYAGNSFDPPAWLERDHGISLTAEVAEAKREIGIKPFPDDWYGPGTMRLKEAAAGLGIDLVPQEKFIDPEKCDPTCDQCMFGCRKGAKWTTREYLEEARRNGAKLYLRADAREVMIGDGGKAEGVRAATPDGELVVEAGTVVLAAGGMGTPLILNRSGIWEAGSNFFMDPMAVVLGVRRQGRGTPGETTFTLASTDFVESDEFIVGSVGAKNALMTMMLRPSTAWHLYKAMSYPRVMGMFAKIADSASGYINYDGTMSKPMTELDQKRMSKGADVCEKVLVAAGCDPRSIGIVKEIGGHPGGTAAMGTVVDGDLQTRVEDLYVCDGSVFPRSPGVPPVLTIVALAKRLAGHLVPEETSS